MQQSLSIEPSPKSDVISFDWSNLTEYRLHSSVPFQIAVKVTSKSILRTIIDEGASVRIISFTAWKAMGSPLLVPATNWILDFNRRAAVPLGILPQLPITLEGKTVCIDVMVVQGPLDFNLLLGRDYERHESCSVHTLLSDVFSPSWEDCDH